MPWRRPILDLEIRIPDDSIRDLSRQEVARPAEQSLIRGGSNSDPGCHYLADSLGKTVTNHEIAHFSLCLRT
jgi:hypothetical protein